MRQAQHTTQWGSQPTSTLKMAFTSETMVSNLKAKSPPRSGAKTVPTKMASIPARMNGRMALMPTPVAVVSSGAAMAPYCWAGAYASAGASYS